LIIYAHNTGSSFNKRASRWWESALNGEETIALPWAVTLAFVRLTTHPRVADPPIPIERVLGIVKKWFTYPAVQPIEPGTSHLRHVSELLMQVQVGAKLVSDAHLAAIAIEHRAVLHTHDRDFERFSGLRLHDPL
jgi:toxin-antitoxin system PIN domain toxin